MTADYAIASNGTSTELQSQVIIILMGLGCQYETDTGHIETMREPVPGSWPERPSKALSFWNVAVWCKIIIGTGSSTMKDASATLACCCCCTPVLRSTMTTGNASASSQMAIAAAAAVGVPGVTRDDEAITGAAGAPLVTIMVEDSQPMPALTQSGAAAYRRLHASNEGIDAQEARIIATASECNCVGNAMD